MNYFRNIQEVEENRDSKTPIEDMLLLSGHIQSYANNGKRVTYS